MKPLTPEAYDSCHRATGRAFGLDIDAGFACLGLPPAPRAADPVVVDLVERDALAEVPADADNLHESRRRDGEVALRLTYSPQIGYRFAAPAYGDFAISGDGGVVSCVPAPDEAWRWQRFLVGQVLPFVALLRGSEVFHASVVRVGDRVAAFTAPSRGGKSSVASALVLSGARLLTDDVMVIAAGDEDLYVQPGFGLASLRHDAVARLGVDAAGRLGEPIGSDADAVRVLIDTDTEARPLTDMYFLSRVPDERGPLIEPIRGIDPRLVLAAGYNYVIRTPARLVQHLDVCARVARVASLWKLAIPPTLGPAEVATAVAHRLATEPT